MASAALSSCQTDTADRNYYDASTEATPGVATPRESDGLAPNIELPPDSVFSDTIPQQRPLR
ncbi:hypothetical protein CDA63_02355 [Hymenobacter amundsenii]|uniref:Uncharacterized protein n=1 Tax=Hymenobacter amundsenii TaxID=2006685 RepID=A0A246FPD8_9BACT|nr:hypothetical protein CDA63_02355 [Hymenobacter amundsenii]